MDMTNTANTFNTFWKGVEGKASSNIGINDCNQQKKYTFSGQMTELKEELSQIYKNET